MKREILIASTRSNKFTKVNKEGYQKYIDNPSRNELIMKIRSEKDKSKQDQLKKILPGTCDHALEFTDGIRHQASAVQSNIYGCDFDFKDNPHMTDPRKYFEEHILPKKDELHLMQCYISTRGRGLQTKCLLPQGASIAEAQQWQAGLVGLKHDSKCTNLDRIFFLPHKDDILYMDEEAYFGEKELPPYTIALQTSHVQEDETLAEQPKEVKIHEMFGIDEMELAKRIVVKVAKHPLPLVEGERNDTLFKAIMKYIYVDSDPNRLLQIFSQFGLDQKEVRTIIKSAMSRKKENKNMEGDVKEIIQNMRAEAGLVTTKSLLPCSPIPKKLPVGIQEWASAAPQGFAPAVILASLPLAGTLATRISFEYLDGNIHRTSFMSHVEGRFASGKSFIRNMADCFLSRIRERDKAAWALEKEYLAKLRRAKNSNEQPEDPKAVIIEVPHNISTAKLMYRMEKAGGRHLIKVCEEIDVSTKANNAGAWSEHSDIDRLAFDNAFYAKDSISMDTYSGMVQVNYNSLTAGTYEATKKHYAKNVENGLMSRTAFACLPDNFAGEMPIFKKFTAKQKNNIEHAIGLLEQAEGKISLPKTLKAIQAWNVEMRKLAMETQSNAIESLYKRAAVMGARAGAIAYILCNGKETKVVTDFALWVASYVLQQQVFLWGSYMENQEEMKSTPLTNLYQELPDEFTRQELIELRIMNGMPENPRMTIMR